MFPYVELVATVSAFLTVGFSRAARFPDLSSGTVLWAPEELPGDRRIGNGNGNAMA